VLGHLPAREAVLGRMVRALRPGWWLLLEEFDSLSMPADPTLNPIEGWPRPYAVMLRLMGDRGVDLRFGRRLPGRLRTHGLVDIDGEARAILVQRGGAWADLLRANFEQLRAAISAAEGWTEAEFDREVAALNDSGRMTPSPLMWADWRRHPAP
jgi:hypothetical protein